MKPLKLYWFDDTNNWGDRLSPLLCERLSGRPAERTQNSKCDLIAIGSLLGRLKSGLLRKRVHVWGTGFMHADHSASKQHYYHAVRGKLTAERIGNATVDVLGDPGLLCDLFMPDTPIQKQYTIGLIPHYRDQGNQSVAAFCERTPGATVIDILSDNVEFLAKLASCERIISSSLHGLVAADSLGIPNAWMKLSDNVMGNGFKFADYYSAFNLSCPEPIQLCPEVNLGDLAELFKAYHRPGLAEIKQRLLESFPFPTP